MCGPRSETALPISKDFSSSKNGWFDRVFFEIFANRDPFLRARIEPVLCGPCSNYNRDLTKILPTDWARIEQVLSECCPSYFGLHCTCISSVFKCSVLLVTFCSVLIVVPYLNLKMCFIVRMNFPKKDTLGLQFERLLRLGWKVRRDSIVQKRSTPTEDTCSLWIFQWVGCRKDLFILDIVKERHQIFIFILYSSVLMNCSCGHAF